MPVLRSTPIRFLLQALLAIGVMFMLVKCDWGSTPVDEQSLVVEAFLDTDEPLPPVLLRQTAPLTGADGQRPKTAEGARVLFTLGETEIPYEESSQRPGQYLPVRDTVVPPQVDWQLTADWDDESARASGQTAAPITIRQVCVDVPSQPAEAIQVDSLRRDSLDIPADQGYLYPIDVTVRWDARSSSPERDSTIWVRAQLRPDASAFSSEVVDFFLEPAAIQRETAYRRTTDARRWTGVYAVPVDSATAPLPRHSLTTALTRGDTAFASFAQTRTDPDRREPISNVDGGLGVALAVSIDSLSKTVTDSLARNEHPQCWISGGS